MTTIPPPSFGARLQQAEQKRQELPPLTPEETSHSLRLIQLLTQEIAANNGALDFSRFMHLALYAPGLGYYAAGKTKLGAAGDFITAPELSPLFGRCLARQCAQVLRTLPHGDILEAGGGSGALAVSLLSELETLNTLPATYFIIEVSADLRARQKERIKQDLPHLYDRVRWLETLPKHGFKGIVLANELLDALPVERFHVSANGVTQLQVGLQDTAFVWRERPAAPELAQRVTPLQLSGGYYSEVNLQAEAWVQTVAAILDTGVVLLIDYGFPHAEFYHPQRAQGTLMCHYRHRAHSDPLILVGLQDITAHVDFTAMAEAGHAAGLAVLGYTTQAAFLLACGLMEFAQQSDPEQIKTHLTLTHQIKKLTLPSEMGELFKVIAFGRNISLPLLGFSLQDRRGRL